MTASPKKPKPNSEGTWKQLILWLLLAFLLRWQVIEPRWIPSGSMLPTLKIQDRILIEKVRPRIKRLEENHLKYGSIVVFSPPEELISSGYDPRKALIKRIIGLPGDQIEVREGDLYRNGLLVNEKWREAPIKYTLKPIKIPENSLWVMGDNRNNSLDSHLWGPLPEENVIGTAIWRYWPLNNFGPIRFPSTVKKEKITKVM